VLIKIVTKRGNTNMSDVDILLTTLELTGEAGIDVTDAAYEYFFEANPKTRELTIHMPNAMLGKMMTALMFLILMEEGEEKVVAIEFEIRTHQEYGVSVLMFEQLLIATYKAVKDAIKPQWTDEFENAWQREIKQLVERIQGEFDKRPSQEGRFT